MSKQYTCGYDWNASAATWALMLHLASAVSLAMQLLRFRARACSADDSSEDCGIKMRYSSTPTLGGRCSLFMLPRISYVFARLPWPRECFLLIRQGAERQTSGPLLWSTRLIASCIV